MSEQEYRTEVKITPEEDQVVQEILGQLTEEEKSNIILQSFTVGAGARQAHDLYTYYLCKVFSLTPRQGGLFIRECLSTLSRESQAKISQIAHVKHETEMKEAVAQKKKDHRRMTLYTEVLGDFEAEMASLNFELPTILGNKAFRDITAEEDSQISQLPKNFSPGVNSVVVQTLRKIAANRGYYDDRKWYQRSLNSDQPTQPAPDSPAGDTDHSLDG